MELEEQIFKMEMLKMHIILFFNRLLKLPEETLLYPAHDYKGDTVSTLGEEKKFNPRLQVTSADEYAAIMNNLNLPDPKMMDIAVPGNLNLGIDFLGGTTIRTDAQTSVDVGAYRSKRRVRNFKRW